MKLYDGGISIIAIFLIIWGLILITKDSDVERHERRYHHQNEYQHKGK